MTAGTMVMTAPALALTGLYAAIVLLLLSLQLKSRWRWGVKSLAIGMALPATVGAFLAIQAQLGWPSRDVVPSNFQLHAALIDEPAAGAGEGGAIYLWLTPFDDMQPAEDVDPMSGEANLDAAMLPSRRPRAFDLPYTRDLHEQVQSMQERLARGEMVIGRHEPDAGWQRRYGIEGGRIDLEAPPPPPLPAKEG